MFIDEKFLLTHKTKIYVSIKISTYCLLCMYDCPIWCFGATKKKTTTSKVSKTATTQSNTSSTPNNVSVKQSTGPQSNLQGFKANKMSTRNGRFGVPEEIAPDRFGLRGGIGQVILLEGEQTDLIPTFEIGAFANIGFTPRSRFQPEINYQSKATKKMIQPVMSICSIFPCYINIASGMMLRAFL
jgi:hypothetical protein